MALDTSVILGGVKAPALNPLQQAGDIANTQNSLLQYRTNMQQMQARTAIGQAYQQASNPQTGAIDYGRLQGIIQSDPRAAWMAPQIAQSIQEQQKRQFDLQDQGLKQNNARSAAFAAGLAPLMRLGRNITETDVFGVFNRMHAQGYPVGDMLAGVAASMPMQAAGQPPDPNYGQKLHDWAVNQFGSSMSAADAARTFLPQVGTMNTGGTTKTYDANPQTNPNATSVAEPNTLTPEGQIAQVKGPVGRGGAQTVQSQAAYAQSQGLGNLLPSTGRPPADASGRPVPAALLGNGGQAPAAASPAATQASAAQPATPGPMTVGLGPGQQAGLDAAGKASADQWATLQNSVGNSATRIYQLQKAQGLLARLGSQGTGPSSPQTQAASSYLASIPHLGSIMPFVNTQNIADYDEANKYLTGYAQNAAGAHGPSTDAQLATALTANASTHISNLAAQDVVRANLGLERMSQAQALSFQNAKDPQTGQALTPDQFSNFSADFNRNTDARAYLIPDLTKTQFQTMTSGMAPADITKLKSTYDGALQQGLVTPPAWMGGNAAPPAADMPPPISAAPPPAAAPQVAPQTAQGGVYYDPVTNQPMGSAQ